LRRASRGFGLPDCGLAAQLAIQAFVEPLTGPRANKKRLIRTQIRSVFIKLTRSSGSYFISEKSVGRMYTSSTRNTLPFLSSRGFAASTYGRNTGSVWSASQFFFASSRLR